jgi:hypothetical protein
MHLVDYSADGLLHGLKSLFGSDVVDYPKHDHMYRSYDRDLLAQLYGKGFTLFGLLPDLHCDRDDIISKIKCKFFDLIIFNKIPFMDLEILNHALENYPNTHILFLDGEDPPRIHNLFVGKGLYFKRELIFDHNQIFPLSYGFPQELMPSHNISKTKQQAFIDPRDRATYIYDTQDEYYADYRSSLWAITMKKVGWDCLRHYEILGNNCMPYFLDLVKCPLRICTSLPKQQLLHLAYVIENYPKDTVQDWQDCDIFCQLVDEISSHFVANCTTTAVAKYVINQPRAIQDLHTTFTIPQGKIPQTWG